MKLSEAQNLFKDQWIAFKIEQDQSDPVGKVVLHEPNRSTFERRMHEERIRGVYITFTGEVLPEGYAAMF